MVALRKPRILIADHDQTFLDQLADRVMQMEMSVDFAEDAYTAIELIEMEHYDLIVLEVGMPIHNGLEILAIAKEIHPKVPVLMIAFSSTKDWAEQALNEGAYTYLLRPLEDIGMFDRIVADGLGTSEASRPTPKTPNDFYLSAMKKELDESPRQSFSKKGSVGLITETESPKPMFGSASPNSASPMGSIAKKEKASKKDPREEVISSLPDGIIEVNMQGQILACNNIARDRLVLESKSRQKPISQFIRSIATKTITETKRIDLTGHNAEIIVKPITDGDGARRTIILIREKIEAVRKLQSEYVKGNRKIKADDSEKLEFKNVGREPIPEYPEEGFSFMLMVDRVKEVVKTELDRVLANSPIEWLSEIIEREPEEVEVDPEMLTAVHRRLSKINGGM